MDRKEIQPVNPKGDQSWVFIGRTDAEAETPILWPPNANATGGMRTYCCIETNTDFADIIDYITENIGMLKHLNYQSYQ